MGREDELGIRKARLQQCADFTAMPLVDGHQHVIEDSEGEALAEQMAHECEIQA